MAADRVGDKTLQKNVHSPPFGYHGRYLHIDVEHATSTAIPIDPSALRCYLGGSGLGVYLLLEQHAAQIEPLDPAAPIAFVFSPLIGSPITTTAKFAVVHKSPLTDRFNDSLASDRFALAGKSTGFDAIMIAGRADRPSVLIIDDGHVHLEPAKELWGMGCSAAEERIRERFGADYSAAVIGPAGEQLVRFASISHNGRHAARGGGGAMLGAKNIKAVLVRGSKTVAWAAPNDLRDLANLLAKNSLGPATARYRELGTASNMQLFERLRALPTRNFQQGNFPAAEKFSPEELSANRKHVRSWCVDCTIGCGHAYSLEKKDDASPRDASPRDASQDASSKDASNESGNVRVEYESLMALGPLCGVADVDAVLRASKRCDDLGMDTISTGGTIAFAMDCVDRGLLDEPWLRFGDEDALLKAIDQIGTRTGLGNSLAEGSRRLAHQIGHNSINFAPQVKGMEIPGYEPRAFRTMAVGFAVAARGADHNRSGAYAVDFSCQGDRRQLPANAHQLAIETEDQAAILDSVILCKFIRNVFDDFYPEIASILRAITGWNVTGDELLTTAKRIVTAKKLFNVHAGWTPAEDTLPDHFFSTPLKDDPTLVLSREQMNDAIRAYNLSRGWSPEGWVTDQHLRDLQKKI